MVIRAVIGTVNVAINGDQITWIQESGAGTLIHFGHGHQIFVNVPYTTFVAQFETMNARHA